MNFKPEDEQASLESSSHPTSEPEERTIQTENKPLPAAPQADVVPQGDTQLTELQAPSVADHPLIPAGDNVHPSSSTTAPPETEGELVEAEPGPGGWEIAKAVVREIVETVILTLIIFFLIQSVIRNFRVDGHSMDPNLHHGQYLVVDKISYNLPFEWRPPQRGDVIVFVPPTHPDKDFVKRVIALPGERVEIKQGLIFINGEVLYEPFGARTDRYSMPARTIPAGEYFVMGDNRANSNDSRNWGALPSEKIVGRAWLSYWPPETWGTIPNDGPSEAATLFYALSNWFGTAEAAP